jgi:hypothetical protein
MSDNVSNYTWPSKMPGANDRLHAALSEAIAGRPVAIVGNATSILGRSDGHLIDSGCVLRMNAGIPVKRASQGAKVDIHCFSTRPTLERNLKKARRGWLPWRNTNYFRDAIGIWMNPQFRDQVSDRDQLFYPIDRWERLADTLKAPPSVGTMALDLIASIDQKAVNVFGFDFKSSNTFYRQRDNRGKHDWVAERRHALALIEEHGWTLHGGAT